jgi:CMP/dCMP kinase
LLVASIAVKRRVVCISHAEGAGGEEVGRLVAERLGCLYVDEEIVARAAAKGAIEPAEVADEERRKSVAARVLAAIAQGGGEAWAFGGVPLREHEELSGDEVRALIRETIEETAARGNAVIVAHAASHVVMGAPGALRVLVTASPDTRATRLAGAEGLDRAQAARAVKNSDRARADYLKRFHDIGEELPTQYDLVVNTDVLSVEQGAELVAQAAFL